MRETETVNVLIADDEPLARDMIRVLLEDHPQIKIIAETENGCQTLEAIRKLRPDLLLLDIQMPEMDGFEVLSQLAPAEIPEVIFVTAYDEYALRAFDVHALDYLLKPFGKERFDQALDRALTEFEHRRAGAASNRLTSLLEDLASGLRTPETQASTSRLVIREGGKMILLRVEEIDWIEAAGDYLCIHSGGKAHLLHETMNRMETRLDPGRFARLHRSVIVNLDRIRELRPTFKGDYFVSLHDGTQLRLSRTQKDRLLSRIEPI